MKNKYTAKGIVAIFFILVGLMPGVFIGKYVFSTTTHSATPVSEYRNYCNTQGGIFYVSFYFFEVG